MIVRPVFVPSIRRGTLFEEVPVSFDWFPGFSLAQKQRSIAAMHHAARTMGVTPVLEVSTKSTVELGRRLSAFNLKIEIEGSKYTLESVYQASKIFSVSGDQPDFKYLDPVSAKRAAREIGKGEIIGFRFGERVYPTEPKNVFYDWLYIRALFPHRAWFIKNVDYYGYSDIEFNPAKSINSQARAVAEFMALLIQKSSEDCYHDFDLFRNLLAMAQRKS